MIGTSEDGARVYFVTRGGLGQGTDGGSSTRPSGSFSQASALLAEEQCTDTPEQALGQSPELQQDCHLDQRELVAQEHCEDSLEQSAISPGVERPLRYRSLTPGVLETASLQTFDAPKYVRGQLHRDEGERDGGYRINNKGKKARRMERRGNCPTVRSKRADVTERLNGRLARDGHGASGAVGGIEPGRRSPEIRNGNVEKVITPRASAVTPPRSKEASNGNAEAIGEGEEAHNGICPNAAEGECVNLYEENTQGAETKPQLVVALAEDDFPDWRAGDAGGNLSSVTARVSPNGRYLAFMSERSLTGFDNRDAKSGVRDEEVYEFDARSGHARLRV